MPVLAIPYVVPFANAAGIVIGSVATAVGLSALSDKVQDYMEENPENSMKILTMIMPAEGLIALFNKEAGDEGEGEGEIELDPKDLTKEEKAKIMKETAKSGSGSMRDRMRKKAKELGLGEDKEFDKIEERYGGVEDPPKPKFDWRSRWRKKADGGRIGFVEGGWADDLTGQGLAIYNSMTAAGHSTQTIQDTLTELGYWGGDAAGTGGSSIVNTQPTLGGGGGGGGQGILDLTYTEGAVPRGPTTDFNINPAAQLTGKGRLDPMGSTYDNLAMMGPIDYKTAGYHMSEIPGQEGYEAPSKYFEEPSLINKGITGIKNFFSGLGTPRVKGTLGTRLSNQPRLPLPASMASWSLSPFNTESRNYNENFVDQLNFLEMQDDYIGRDQGSGLLKYGPESVLRGKNVISMFGSNDYEVALNKYLTRMRSYTDPTENQLKKIKKAKLELEVLQNQNKGDADKITSTTYTGPDASDWNPNITTAPTHIGAGPLHGVGGNQGGYNHPGSAESRRSSDPFNEGGLATMFQRR